MSHDGQNGQFVQWMVRNGTYQPCPPTVPQLPPGAYTCTVDYQGNTYLKKRELRADDLITFEDCLPSRILREIDRFWTLGERFRHHGFLHRRGYLLYGKQGCGKSSLVYQILSHVVEQGNVALFGDDPHAFVQCVEEFRAVEPDRPMVCIFEDIDAIFDRYGDTALLQWLDGNQQVDKAVNIATTNYPEKLDRRILARPRRFDRVMKIETPDARLRSAYLEKKLPDQSAHKRDLWVKMTEGLSFAGLAELIISVYCLGHELEQSVAVLKELDCHEPNSEDYDACEMSEQFASMT